MIVNDSFEQKPVFSPNHHCFLCFTTTTTQGIHDNYDIFKLPCGKPILEAIQSELVTHFPQDDRIGRIVLGIQECLDTKGPKYWKK